MGDGAKRVRAGALGMLELALRADDEEKDLQRKQIHEGRGASRARLMVLIERRLEGFGDLQGSFRWNSKIPDKFYSFLFFSSPATDLRNPNPENKTNPRDLFEDSLNQELKDIRNWLRLTDLRLNNQSTTFPVYFFLH